MSAMTELQREMEASMKLYRRLQAHMEAMERRLPLLDIAATLEATRELESLHDQIVAKDSRLLDLLDPANVSEIVEQVQERRLLIETILALNRSLAPKLKTRLAGYRDELLRIRSGITSMQGYQYSTDRRGQRLDTVN